MTTHNDALLRVGPRHHIVIKRIFPNNTHFEALSPHFHAPKCLWGRGDGKGGHSYIRTQL